jgi:hypothetical protein
VDPPISSAGARSGNSTRSAQPGPGGKRLESSELNQARIASWVGEGGPCGAADKVISPIPRLLDQVRSSVLLVDGRRVDDNSSAVDPMVAVFTLTIGSFNLHRDPLRHEQLAAFDEGLGRP